jgi:hypothetical protein
MADRWLPQTLSREAHAKISPLAGRQGGLSEPRARVVPKDLTLKFRFDEAWN